MSTLGPTATTADVSTFTNFASWAGTGTFGINTALTNFGWTRTVDGNQVSWASPPTAAPFQGPAASTYPLTNMPTGSNYFINSRGTWVSGTLYNVGDVAFDATTATSYYLFPAVFTLSSVANSSGGTAVYTGTITNGGSNAYAGSTFTIAGFASANNNGTYLCTASSTTTLTLNNGFATAQSQATTATQITSNGTVVPSTDTTHWFAYHYEIWKTNDSATYTITAVSRTSGGLATFTCNNGGANGARLKAGFNVTVTGLTNVPSLNGTWSVFSATTTNFTVQTGGGTIGTTSDSGTVTYKLQPICMKFEYFGNTSPYTTAPWVRLSFGTGTDGVGNLTGNVIGSPNGGPSLINASAGMGVIDLLSSSTTASGAQTSTIWRCIASGSNSRFGTSLWYNRNDTNAANSGSLAWIVERGKDDSGNEIDDYFTHIALCAGSQGIFNTSARFTQQRSILKWNPSVSVASVTVDGSNNLTLRFSSNTDTGYSFAPGAIVFLGGFAEAAFLNDQFVTQSGFSLTSVATSVGSTAVYTGTITGGAANAYAGVTFTVVGFTTAANNGTFLCSASSTTTLTLNNASAVSETHAAQVAPQNAIITSFTNAAYATAPDTGTMKVTTSASLFTPLAGTGLPCWSDPRPCTILTTLTNLTVNSNTPLFPVFPVPGFLGNPMTMCAALRSGNQPTHDTTTTITLYGTTRTYYFNQGTTQVDPYIRFGDTSASNGFALRWD